MNVTCPDCRTVYRVDPRKIPEGGVVARCARCPAEFTIGSETEVTAVEVPVRPIESPAADVGAEAVYAEPHPSVTVEASASPEPVAEASEAPVASEWVQPTASSEEPGNQPEDRSWLVQGSAWVEAIAATVDEPTEPLGSSEESDAASLDSPEETEAVAQEAASFDLETPQSEPELNEGRISVTVDYVPDVVVPEAASEPIQTPSAVSAESRAEEAALTEAAAGEEPPAGYAAEGGGEPPAEYGVETGGEIPAEHGIESSGEQPVEHGIDAGSHQPAGYAGESGAGQPVGYGSEAGGEKPAEYDIEPIEVRAEGAAHEEVVSPEEAVNVTSSSEWTRSDAQEPVEVGATAAEAEVEPLAQDAVEHREGTESPVEPVDSTVASDERSTIELVGAMPEPVQEEEPRPSEPWSAGQEESPIADEVANGSGGVSREREEVLVSANAGSIEAITGVGGPDGGEGFTSVPARADQEVPLPPPPFGSTDPHARAKRLARALVSDIVVYNSDRRERSIRMGTIRQEFREEIRKSWEEYVAHVGNQLARDTSYFRDALNELLAGGNRLF